MNTTANTTNTSGLTRATVITPLSSEPNNSHTEKPAIIIPDFEQMDGQELTPEQVAMYYATNGDFDKIEIFNGVTKEWNEPSILTDILFKHAHFRLKPKANKPALKEDDNGFVRGHTPEEHSYYCGIEIPAIELGGRFEICFNSKKSIFFVRDLASEPLKKAKFITHIWYESIDKARATCEKLNNASQWHIVHKSAAPAPLNREDYKNYPILYTFDRTHNVNPYSCSSNPMFEYDYRRGVPFFAQESHAQAQVHAIMGNKAGLYAPPSQTTAKEQ